MLPGPNTKSLILLAVIPFLAQVALSDSSASSSSQLTTSQLISQANVLLSSGQAHKALELYELALERNPDDYLTLYKKATTQMSLGQYTHASHAFQKVLSLSEFERARLQLAKIHLKMGDYEACESELASCSDLLKSSKPDPEALRVQEDLKAAQKHLKSARANHKSKRWDKCVEESTATIQYSPQSIGLRQLRSDCHIIQGHLQEAVGDLTRVSQLLPNSPLPALRVSTLSYFFLAQPLEAALKPIKQCLHSDPESKPCKKVFRLLKAVEKDLAKVRNFINSNGYRSAIKILSPKGKEDEGLIEQVKQTIKESQAADPKAGIDEPLLSPTIVDADKHSELLTTLHSYVCQAYIGLDEIEASKKPCNVLYERDNDNVWGVIGKAEVLMAGEEWEQAVQLLNNAHSKNENNEDLAKRLRKAQKGLKVSKQKDYYKVLGVSRTADEKALKKAYRKASLKAHPDKGGSQAKMAALNEAYEVLSDPKLRARYDNGDDPNDPTSGQNPFQGGANPIFQQFFQQQGGNPFGGGGFQGSSGGQTFSFRFG